MGLRYGGMVILWVGALAGLGWILGCVWKFVWFWSFGWAGLEIWLVCRFGSAGQVIGLGLHI